MQKFGSLLLLPFLLSVSCRTPEKDDGCDARILDKDLRYSGSDLDPALDICPYWFEGLYWDCFQKIRGPQFNHPGAIKYVNKILSNEMLTNRGIETIPILMSSKGWKVGDPKPNIAQYIKDHNLKSYVAKPSHMSQNNGLVVVVNGKRQPQNVPIAPEEVQKIMDWVLDTPSNSNEWLLQNMEKGWVLQPYIAERIEFKIQTIWGKAQEGLWYNGKSGTYYSYDIEGHRTGKNKRNLPYPREIWKQAVRIAEKVAENTDALRVDIMVQPLSKGKYKLLVNELELRSQVGWTNDHMLSRLLNDGYRGKCVKTGNN